MKLVTFDFWNTLFVDKDEDIRHKKRIAFAFEAMKQYRPALQLNDVEFAFGVAHEDFNTQWQERKSCSMHRHCGRLISHLEMILPEQAVAQMVNYFETVLLEHPPVLISGAAEAVSLCASALNLGLISDTGYSPGSTLRKILDWHGIDRLFHAYSFSNETGYLKPSAEAFYPIFKQLNIAPEDAVHIGDLEETDILGAKQMGMKAIKYIGHNPGATNHTIADRVISDWKELPNALRSLS